MRPFLLTSMGQKPSAPNVSGAGRSIDGSKRRGLRHSNRKSFRRRQRRAVRIHRPLKGPTERGSRDADPGRRCIGRCGGVARIGARSRDRNGRRDLGFGAAACRLAPRHRQRRQFPRLGLRRLRRRRRGRGGGGGDRHRRAAHARVRGGRRDSVAGRALLRRPKSRSLSRSSTDAARRPQDHECGPGRPAGRRHDHASR